MTRKSLRVTWLGGALAERRQFAVRPQPRPWECELGHCGVDLAAPSGTLVVAVADGIVERVERSASGGGRAGRYVRIAHCDGGVVTRYIHPQAKTKSEAMKNYDRMLRRPLLSLKCQSDKMTDKERASD